MNAQQRAWFQELREERSKAADALESFGLRGLKKGASDNYSDKAHFVYELLQNADDAGATSVTFHLCPDKLIFVHNGTRRFTISNPKTEAEDKEQNRLGDVNSITAYHESTKSENGLNSIGTFGIGFKAVYLYTSEPLIYDGEINFAIEREMVPRVIEGDIPERSQDETAFVLPFNHPEISATQAHGEIASKLDGLSYPLLFLNNLRDIYIQVDGAAHAHKHESLYTKRVTSLGDARDIIQECVELSHEVDGKTSKSSTETLVVFSRVIDGGQRCSVGYFMDENGKLVARDRPAFCFFPTHVKTGLGFVIQAPFQLTNSREVIVASEYNVDLIDTLAELAADSLLCLRDLVNSKDERLLDDGIVKIIPIKGETSSWYNLDESLSTVSFNPFYQSMQEAFCSQSILPGHNGYTSAKHAYWAATREISALFDDAQLQQLTGDKEAMWVFCSKPASNDKASSFIREVVRTTVDDIALLQGIRPKYYQYLNTPTSIFNPISSSFIETQTRKWLSRFYAWVCETQRKIDAAKVLPILLDNSGKAISAYNSEDKRAAYPPTTIALDGYPTVASWILEDKNGSELVKKLEICAPKEDDVVYRSILLPLEADKNNDGVDEEKVSRQLRYLFEYYKGLPRRLEPAQSELFKRLSDCYILPVCYPDGPTNGYDHSFGKPSEAYLPSELLSAYFSNSRAAFFVDPGTCARILGSAWSSEIESFLLELGAASSPRFVDVQLTWAEAYVRNDTPKDRSTDYQKWVEPRMNGLGEALAYVSQYHDEQKSDAIWKVLSNCAADLDRLFEGTYSYFFYHPQKKHFESSSALALKTEPWLFTADGKIKSPADITLRELADFYDVNSPSGKKVVAFLGIRDNSLENLVNSGALTREDAEDIQLARYLKKNGITREELNELIKHKQEEKNAQIQLEALAQAQFESTPDTAFDNGIDADSYDGEDSDDAPALRAHDRKRSTSRRPSPIDGTKASTNWDESTGDDEVSPGDTQYDGIQSDWHTLGVTVSTADAHAPASIDKAPQPEAGTHQERKGSRSSRSDPKQQATADDGIDDAEETAPFRGIDYDKAISRAQEAGDRESERARSMKVLHDVAIASEKYSYSWFASRLRLESLSNGDGRDSRAVSIRFGLVEPEAGTKRTISLRQPSSYIPQRMEELSDIPLVLHMADGERRVTIEVASVLPDRLKVKAKDPASIRGIDFRNVIEASINVQSPAFLLQSLIAGFDSLGLADGYDLKDNLRENIEFVFGPPGTGKTTYLARELLVPLMRKKEKPRVLVLAPTNKAADVLTLKILEVLGRDKSWKRWLARFGVTADEGLESSGAYRDREFDFAPLQGIVGITTIARFAYDYITIGGKKQQVQDLDWDYVFVDEASMVPIANITYLLYKANPKKFIIAGDPHQIEPVDTGNLWQGENIYSMVGLKSFANPHTEPHDYKVRALSVQYRSVPAIGGIVSKLTYDGKLTHARSVKEQGEFPVAPGLGIAAINIVRFPVSTYEGIYHVKKLGKSPC